MGSGDGFDGFTGFTVSLRSSALAAASGTGGGSIFVPVLISFSYLQAPRRSWENGRSVVPTLQWLVEGTVSREFKTSETEL